MKRQPTPDPVEQPIADALDIAGIRYERGKPLDFFLPELDLHIECKQFYSDRAVRQLATRPNVILVQGVQAAKFLALRIVQAKLAQNLVRDK